LLIEMVHQPRACGEMPLMTFADTMRPVFRMEAVTAAVSEFTTGKHYSWYGEILVRSG
jgi:hypothetical protein